MRTLCRATHSSRRHGILIGVWPLGASSEGLKQANLHYEYSTIHPFTHICTSLMYLFMYI